MSEVKQQNLTAVEKQVVLLAMQKNVNGMAQVAMARQAADALELQVRTNFDQDTLPVQQAHGLDASVKVLYDMRDDTSTMFLQFSSAEGKVIGAIAPAQPIDPLT